MVKINITVNGKSMEAMVRPDQTLLSFLRDDLELMGTKESCSVGECGACTVVLNGKAVKSCVTLAAQCDGKSVLTIEGLAGPNGELHPIQQAFVDTNAVQCGFCTPGFVMKTYAFTEANPNPTHEEIVEAVSSNLCRCTGYVDIVKAVELYIERKNSAE